MVKFTLAEITLAMMLQAINQYAQSHLISVNKVKAKKSTKKPINDEIENLMTSLKILKVSLKAF